jgi:hypothetical protein
VVVYLLWAGGAAVCCLHCSHRCCDNVALDLPGLLLSLWSIYFSEYLIRLCAYVVVLGVGAILPRLEVCVVKLIFLKFYEPLIGVVYLVSLQPPIASSIVRRLLAVAPSAYRGSACRSTFLVLTNLLRKPFAEALGCVSFLALAASCSAASIGGGVLLLGCGLDCPGSHFTPALWFKRSCTLTSLCTCRLGHYDRSTTE